MPFTAAGRATADAAVTAAYPYLALFDGDPTAGGVEVGAQGNGTGSPAYARRLLANVPVAFDVPAGDTVAAVAIVDALSGGVVGAWQTVPSDTYGAQGTYTVNTADVEVT